MLVSSEHAVEKSGHSEDEIIEMTAMLLENAIRTTACGTDVFGAISSSESLVTHAPLPVRRKRAAISQAIIAACRTRSYMFGNGYTQEVWVEGAD